METALGVGGKDDFNADGSRVTVFGGHGWRDQLHFGQRTLNSEDSLCSITPSDDMELGGGGGSEAELAIFASSCFLYTPSPVDNGSVDDIFGMTSPGLVLGFHDSPTLLKNALWGYYNSLPANSYETSDVWITTMTGLWGLDSNRPVFLILLGEAESSDDAWNRGAHVNMKTASNLSMDGAQYAMANGFIISAWTEDLEHDCD